MCRDAVRESSLTDVQARFGCQASQLRICQHTLTGESVWGSRLAGNSGRLRHLVV